MQVFFPPLLTSVSAGGGNVRSVFCIAGCRLEALPVHDGGAGLIVLLLADPHLLEGGERGQDGASDPHRVFTLRRGDDLWEREREIEDGAGRHVVCYTPRSHSLAIVKFTVVAIL